MDVGIKNALKLKKAKKKRIKQQEQEEMSINSIEYTLINVTGTWIMAKSKSWFQYLHNFQLDEEHHNLSL